jgi:hypothetical protein
VVVPWQDPDAGNVTWTGTLPAGSFEVVVGSHGISSLATPTNYGFDVGTYTITGAVVRPANYLAPPTALTATGVSTSQINLAWTNNATGATDNLVERSSDGGTSFAQIADLAASSSTYSDTGLTAGTTYVYRVRAYYATTATDSSYSNAATATTAAPPQTIPAAPSNLTASAVSATTIHLSWVDNSTNETGFSIERASYNPKGKLGSWSQIATVGAGVTSFDNTKLNSSTYYDYRIRVYNNAGYSAYAYATQPKVLAGMTAGGHNLAGADYTADGLDILPLVPSGVGGTSTDAAQTQTGTNPDLPSLDELAAGLALEASQHPTALPGASAARPWA